MMISGVWLLLSLLVPLGLAVLLMIWPRLRTALSKIAPWSALPALCIAMLPVEFATAVIPDLLLGSQAGLDDTGRYFLLLTALVWLVAGLCAKQTFARPERPGFFILFLLAMAGNFGVVIAGDILSFYLSFALMSFAAYGLVIHAGTTEALRAGRIYIVFVVLGEVMLLSALMLAASQAQGYDFEAIRATVAQSEYRNLIIALTVMGLGIKIGLPGLHVTLPLIYRVAPMPATVALAGAMINAGVLGWLRLLPAGDVALPEWSAALMVLGLLAAFYGVVVGLTQREAKTLLAYSSVSQMGILTFAVGLGLAAPQAWPSMLMIITLYAVHHGLAKAALFVGLDVTQRCADCTQWRWLLLLGLALPALALAGAPLTSGMLAKAILKAHLGFAAWADVLGWLLSISSLATTLLVIRFFYLLWPLAGWRSNSKAVTAHASVSLSEYRAWLSLLLASLVGVWFMPVPIVLDWFSLSLWWLALWPVLAGVLVAIIGARFVKTNKMTIPEIPVGDMIVPLEFMVQKLVNLLVWFTSDQLPRWQKNIAKNITTFFGGYRETGSIIELVETKLSSWFIAGTLLLIVILAFVI